MHDTCLHVLATIALAGLAGCGPAGGGAGGARPLSPQISSVSPTHGGVGQAVTILGTAFANSASGESVFFGSTQAAVKSAQTTQIIAAVPPGTPAGSAPITVSTIGGTSNTVNFTADPGAAGGPSITSLSPASGPVGTSVRILGNNFDSNAANDAVTFNGTSAAIASASTSEIDTTVPPGATSGVVVVTTGAGSSNGVAFTVTSAQPSDQGSSGSQAANFLTAVPYSNLLVEIQPITGEDPDSSSVSLLQQRLGERLHKPGGITAQIDPSVPSPGIARWQLSDVSAFERAHRQSYSQGNTAVLYYLYVDRGYVADTSSSKILGISYTGSSIVLFKENIRATTSISLSGAAIEQAVIVHEAGHALGLVDNGVPLQSPHSDPQHPPHCSNTSCVMIWQVDSNALSQLFGTVPNEFRPDCIADLQAAGGK